jgi:hypothetical protein
MSFVKFTKNDDANSSFLSFKNGRLDIHVHSFFDENYGIFDLNKDETKELYSKMQSFYEEKDPISEYMNWIGLPIRKKSNNPFSSGEKVDRVIGITNNDHSSRVAFLLQNSKLVDCHQCLKIEEIEN